MTSLAAVLSRRLLDIRIELAVYVIHTLCLGHVLGVNEMKVVMVRGGVLGILALSWLRSDHEHLIHLNTVSPACLQGLHKRTCMFNSLPRSRHISPTAPEILATYGSSELE
jgi:hypothetical protein